MKTDYMFTINHSVTVLVLFFLSLSSYMISLLLSFLKKSILGQCKLCKIMNDFNKLEKGLSFS